MGGVPCTHVAQQTTPTPRDVSEHIGKKYVELNSLPQEDTDMCEFVYNQLAETVIDLYSQIPVPVVFQENDPYDSYEDMARTVGEERQLRVYAGHADAHPLMSEWTTLAFRAVHDWHGHLKHDVPFTAEGEFRKWWNMRDDFQPLTNRALFAEVCGQVGQAHYLEDGFESDRFTQRAFLAPDDWIDPMIEAVDPE